MENDRNTPATKIDIHDLGEHLCSEFRRGCNDLKKAFRDSQTELLKAFSNFAQTADARFKESEISDIGLRQRLTAVEIRLTEIEKRLNVPPAA